MAKAKGSGSSFGEAFREAVRDAGGRGPLKSYTAKSASARYKHLMRTREGREALEQAGLGAAQQTRRRWFTGKQKPGKEYSGVINGVYEALRRPRIPDEIKQGKMRITGRVGTGNDIRNRGEPGQAPLLIDLSNGNWDSIDQILQDQLGDEDPDDVELENAVSEDLIEPDIGGSDNWYFPGGSYTVEFDY